MTIKPLAALLAVDDHDELRIRLRALRKAARSVVGDRGRALEVAVAEAEPSHAPAALQRVRNLIGQLDEADRRRVAAVVARTLTHHEK